MPIVKVPNPLKIGMYVFRIVANHILPLSVAGCYGSIDPTTEELHLAVGLTSIQRHATLNHEVLHQISRNYCCGLDEATVDRLAEGLTDFQRDTLGIELDWSEIDANNS